MRGERTGVLRYDAVAGCRECGPVPNAETAAAPPRGCGGRRRSAGQPLAPERDEIASRKMSAIFAGSGAMKTPPELVASVMD